MKKQVTNSHSDVRSPMPLEKLALEAGVPLSKARQYIKQNEDKFHPIQGPSGKLYSPKDITVLKQIHDQGKSVRKRPQTDNLTKKVTTSVPINTSLPFNQKTEYNAIQIQSMFQEIQTKSEQDEAKGQYDSITGHLEKMIANMEKLLEIQSQLTIDFSERNQKLEEHGKLLELIMEKNLRLEEQMSTFLAVNTSTLAETAVTGSSKTAEEVQEIEVNVVHENGAVFEETKGQYWAHRGIVSKIFRK